MKKKNILFQTAVVACLLFGTGINMSSCIEQTFPKSSTAISEQIAESPAAMNAMLNAVVGFVNAYNTLDKVILGLYLIRYYKRSYV